MNKLYLFSNRESFLFFVFSAKMTFFDSSDETQKEEEEEEEEEN